MIATTTNLTNMKNLPLRFGIILSVILLFSGCYKDQQVKNLTNNLLSIDLHVNGKGVPYIGKVYASDNSIVYFTDASSGMALQNRLTRNFIKGETVVKPFSGWDISEDSIFYKAQATVMVNDCEFTIHVELMKDSPLFIIYNSVSGNIAMEIKEFPILSSDLGLSDSTQSIRWWKALEFTPQKEPVNSDTHLSLNSQIHSADNYNNVEGNVPYWTIETPECFIGFSLAWCGGWRASLNGRQGILTSDIYLQENETQLKLNPGETVKGPEISVFCSPVSDHIMARKDWLNTRTQLARKLYPSPEIGIPFIYNHWYSVRFALSEKFIKDQVRWFKDFGFDVFMIDAGWYKGYGSWTPSPLKFKPNEFENALKTIRLIGAIPGLWSCPQFIEIKEPFPAFIDQPGYYSPSLKSWLIDYNAIDFNSYLIKHLDTLHRVGADWWKFDQEFFAIKPREGKLKSVNAFQIAFATARRKYPDMIFEACMGGGKIINEFTDQISQIHWIRDGNRTGYVHALTNIHEALGAVDFLEPQKVQRWTNRIDETEMKTPDLLKFYCRSCMIGSWGISADLNKISTLQREIIVDEVKNYKRINEIKKDNLIEFNYPTEYITLVPAIFYNISFTKAAILLYSLAPNEKPVKFKIKTRLSAQKNFEFFDADAKRKAAVKGNVFELSLLPGQNSAIFFLDEITSKE